MLFLHYCPFSLCTVHCGTAHLVSSPPSGTIERDGHLGLGMLYGTLWDIPPGPIPSHWYNGRGWTLGIGHATWYIVGHPTWSHPLPVVQWDWMDTWDWACSTVHCGSSHLVPSRPIGTMGRDGHLGLGMLHGTLWDIPPGPISSQWYNGTGWTLGIGHALRYIVGHPTWSHLIPLVQWDGMDTWDWACYTVHCGTSHLVPSPPSGTMGRDGLGLGMLLGHPIQS